VPFRCRLWNERLLFRDYLRTHPNVASDYAKLKELLAQKYRDDREAYTDAKSSFINRIIEGAQENLPR